MSKKKFPKFGNILSRESMLVQSARALDRAAILAAEDDNFDRLVVVSKQYEKISRNLGSQFVEQQEITPMKQAQFGFGE